MNITTEDLRKLKITPFGGLPESPITLPTERQPLSPAVIAVIVASHKPPTRDPLRMPRVLGCDPSLNEAGFAMVGGQRGEVYTNEFHSADSMGRAEKVLSVARFALDFAESGFRPDVVVVEGVWYRNSSAASAESIQGYSEAVGAVQGALCRYQVLRVEPSWMPDLLMLYMAGGSEKHDRHAVARGLLERSGIEWPDGLTEHEADAVCLATAWLVQEGWV